MIIRTVYIGGISGLLSGTLFGFISGILAPAAIFWQVAAAIGALIGLTIGAIVGLLCGLFRGRLRSSKLGMSLTILTLVIAQTLFGLIMMEGVPIDGQAGILSYAAINTCILAIMAQFGSSGLGHTKNSSISTPRSNQA